MLLLMAAGERVLADGGSIDFEQQIAPILEQHCIRCHSPGNRQGDVSLATFNDLQANDFVTAGDPENSYLLDLVRGSDDKAPEMPQQGRPLSEDELTLLSHWISQGAIWPDEVVLQERPKADAHWWAFQPLVSHDPPRPSDLSPLWDTNPIDAFIVAKLREQGLSPNPRADRRVLIRRATYDLLGMPPSPEQTAAFVNDPDPWAYEKLIDRLLQSPQYGERWGRHWLDVVRFGESNGFERNVIINSLWPFRDYVIRSINEDKPFDQFIREHIAGDVLGDGEPGLAVGTAFLVAGPYDDVGNQDAAQAAQIRANTLDEIISASGEAFLGLTLGCARCHDHKFDPITQQDYYGLVATFAGVRHGEVPLLSAAARAERDAKLEPLNRRKAELETSQRELRQRLLGRAKSRIEEYEAAWHRPPVDRTGTEEVFPAVTAKYVRLICESQDINPDAAAGFRIDEFEIWSDASAPVNVALAANGGKASGRARQIEDFPDAYGPQLAIDGKTGARFISSGTDLTIELAQPTRISRVLFSSARGEETPKQPKFVFVAEYRIEVSEDGHAWLTVATGRDRRPASPKHLERRLLLAEATAEEVAEERRLGGELAQVNREIGQLPAPPSVWIGTRNAADAKGPFHLFLGGDPQRKGAEVNPSGLAVLDGVSEELGYRLASDVPESRRREAFAQWITHRDNPLTPRVLANRLWHYHFGAGIVDTPSDFGYMGAEPTHPELLDFLALQLKRNGWRLKPMHRLIMTSETYRQSSQFREPAARMDAEAKLLWRFPPRRLSAEEIRDTMLQVAGVLQPSMGGPGFRLYHFMQDNVCTYVPLDQHGPETYRRAVYHQNARASVVDLMTDFDQPDCAFTTPNRGETTTPLQALTMLNHHFSFEMARAMAERIRRDVEDDPAALIGRAYQLSYGRAPDREEAEWCTELLDEHGLIALCRALLNTSELIYVE